MGRGASGWVTEAEKAIWGGFLIWGRFSPTTQKWTGTWLCPCTTSPYFVRLSSLSWLVSPLFPPYPSSMRTVVVAFSLSPYQNPPVDTLVVASAVVASATSVVVSFLVVSAIVSVFVDFVVAVSSVLLLLLQQFLVMMLLFLLLCLLLFFLFWSFPVLMYDILLGAGACHLPSPPHHFLPNSVGAFPHSSTTVVIVGRGCGAMFLPRHAFDMYPEAPHDQGFGRRPSINTSILFPSTSICWGSLKSFCGSLIPREQSPR